MSTEIDKSINTNDELQKALHDLGISLEPDDIKKGDGEEEKEEYNEEKYGEMEKAYGKMQADYDSMKKSMDAKKAEMDEYKKKYPMKKSEEDGGLKKSESSEGGKIEDKKEEKKIEKSDKNPLDIINDFIIKAIDNKFNELKGDSIEKSENSKKAEDKNNDKIEKSIDSLASKLNEIAKNVETIGSNSQGRKSVTNHSFIEKADISENRDENGKMQISINKQKQLLLKSMEDIFNKMPDTDINKGMYADAIVNMNAGGVAPSQDLVIDLFKNHNIHLVK